MILQFLGIPLRWEYRGYMYTMWFLDMSLRWVYPSLFKYFVVFALRCWTMSYYDIVSCVYYVFLDIPLIWACHLLCMVLSDHTSVIFIYSLLVHQGTGQGLK